MKKIGSLLFCILMTYALIAQQERPKLIVGIVVDQMRNDFIHNYWDKYGEGGFKKLLKQGFYCKNTHYNYVPTYTGPGHASIYTGTTPATHGIIANTWYNKYIAQEIYCTQDDSVFSVDVTGKAGKMSPTNLKASTITDELKISTNGRAKVIGVSLKDRGAILPSGHAADAAYWMDNETGNWISSSFYMDKLPGWVKGVNDANAADAFIKKGWNTLLPISNYVESIEDNNSYEGLFAGELQPVFPHNLTESFEDIKYEVIKYTPYGNTLLRLFAESAIENESLGQDNITDFLTLSFSSTDYIGHMYGPKSVEIEDTYLRLDKELEGLLKYLDSKVGDENYTVFLTADHGAVEVPKYLKDQKQSAGYYNSAELVNEVNTCLNEKYGDGQWIAFFSNNQFYYSDSLKTMNMAEVNTVVKECLLKQEGVSNVFTKDQIVAGNSSNAIFTAIQLGFNQKLSGDLVVVFEPNWIKQVETGTTHGTPYNYDTHVPLIWFGKGISTGSTVRRVEITDIAVTLSHLYNINLPNAAIGNPIEELFYK